MMINQTNYILDQTDRILSEQESPFRKAIKLSFKLIKLIVIVQGGNVQSVYVDLSTLPPGVSRGDFEVDVKNFDILKTEGEEKFRAEQEEEVKYMASHPEEYGAIY